jgi:hypothetical protein
MKKQIEKELLYYYVTKNKLIDSNNTKDKVKLNIINMMIKRIKLILKLSNYVKIEKIIRYEKILLDKNYNKNIDYMDGLYVLKWLEYSRFLDRITIKLNTLC